MDEDNHRVKEGEDERYQRMEEEAVLLVVAAAADYKTADMREPEPDMMRAQEAVVAGASAGEDASDDLVAEAHGLSLEETVTQEGRIW